MRPRLTAYDIPTMNKIMAVMDIAKTDKQHKFVHRIIYTIVAGAMEGLIGRIKKNGSF